MSLNVQGICDSNLKFRNIVARWPGSTHDSTIFNNCYDKIKFDEGQYNGYLLGDSGYACSSYLLTPLSEPNSPQEHLYNEAHIRTRNCIERAFGIWKRRFPILAIGCRVKPEKTFAIIVATAVLHNILRQAGEPLPPDDPDLPLPWAELIEQNEIRPVVPLRRENENFRCRRKLIENYFRSL